MLTLPVEDVDATFAELIGRGATPLNGPTDRPWGIRTASFADPSGYIWELGR
jgi:lactoylglutathione lyase